MGKPFFEVFPSLKLDGGIHDIMEQTTVEKISATKSRDFLRIYLFSTRLIVKDDIWSAEEQIKKQLFPTAEMTVKIYEKFELSAQYTPQKLMNIYRDSILAELKEYSHVEYNAFRTAEITYPEENKVILSVEDNVLTRLREEELVRVLEKILVERCGFPVTVQVEYREAVTGKFDDEDELKIQMQVAEIRKKVASAGRDDASDMGNGAQAQDIQNGAGYGNQGSATQNSASQGGDAQGTVQGSANQGSVAQGSAAQGSAAQGQPNASQSGATQGSAAGSAAQGNTAQGNTAQGSQAGKSKAASPMKQGFQGKSEFKKGENGKGDFKKDFKKGEFSRGGDYNRGSVKRSDNPDVLYGRDFDEEAIKIEDIIGEMGEVVIRGKILNLDKREIKNEKTIIIFDVTDFTDTMTVKIFARNDQVAEILEGVKAGAFIKIKGISMVDKFDHELTIGSVAGIKKIPDFTSSRKDTAAHKRVELH